MKYTLNSYRVIRAEASLNQLLRSDDPRSFPPFERRLDIFLAHLLSALLALDPTWPTGGRWIDFIRLSWISRPSPQVLEALGCVYWNVLNYPGNGDSGLIEVRLELDSTCADGIDYYIQFRAEGVSRSFNAEGALITAGPNDKEASLAIERFEAFIAAGDYRLATALGRSGPEGLDALRRTLLSDNSKARSAVLRAVRHWGDLKKDFIPQLVSALNDQCVAARYHAAVSLWLTVKEDRDSYAAMMPAIPLLIEALESSISGSRPHIAEALAALAPLCPEIVDALIDRLRFAEDPYYPAVTLSHIGALAETATQPLKELLKRSDRQLYSVVLQAFWGIGTEAAIAEAIECLSDSNAEVRHAAIRAAADNIAADNPNSIVALPVLESLVLADETDESIRCQVVKCLGRSSIGGERRLRTLDQATPILLRNLQQGIFESRTSCLEALAAIGGRAASAAFDLAMDRLQIKDDYLDPDSCGIFELLLAMTPEELTAGLSRASLRPELDCIVVGLLRRLTQEGAAEDGGKERQKLCNPETIEYIRGKAIAALPMIRDKLLGLSQPRDPMDDEELFANLSAIGSASVPILRELIDCNQLVVDALRTLADFGPEQAPLIARKLSSSCPSIREQAAKSLGRLGDAAAPYADALSEMLRDEVIEVRIAAESALTRICAGAVNPLPSSEPGNGGSSLGTSRFRLVKR